MEALCELGHDLGSDTGDADPALLAVVVGVVDVVAEKYACGEVAKFKVEGADF